jgi:site-specific recombinase XerC
LASALFCEWMSQVGMSLALDQRSVAERALEAAPAAARAKAIEAHSVRRSFMSQILAVWGSPG